MEIREALAPSPIDLSSRTTSEVDIMVETTSTTIMEEATTAQWAPDLSSTLRSSRLSFAVTLCNKELALSPNHVYSHTESMN